MPLTQLLSEIYPPADVLLTYTLLDSHALTNIINKHVNVVKELETSAFTSNDDILNTIPALSSLFLAEINSKISTITDEFEKCQIEQITSDIAHVLLKRILGMYTGNNAILLKALYNSLQTVSRLNDYNFEELKKYFPVHRFIEIQPLLIPVIYKPVYYKWNCHPFNLYELSDTLKSKNIVKKTKDFQGLFEKPTEKYSIQFNRNFHDEIIVLFDILKSKKHISTIGNKGHFMPIKLYAVDFENQPLIISEPKTVKYTLKKNAKKWATLNDTVNKWILNFKQQ